MYERDVGTGTVGWDPAYPDVAAEVMSDCEGCPHDDVQAVQEAAPVQMDAEQCAWVNEEYRRRVEADPDKQMGGTER